MKFYVTRYALTVGIKEVEAEEDPALTDYPNMLSVKSKNGYYGENYHGKDWHRTREEALKNAETKRLKKIDSLKKSLKKLETMKFE